jgi:Xaa-Pro aminopeptidase
MFQTFETTTSPQQGPARLAALRKALEKAGYDGCLVPRADMYQGEYVAECDERLAWLTGFTGSAGFCVVLPQIAGVFIDGRYRTQVKSQVDLGAFTPVPWPEVKPADWLREHLHDGGRIAFDPWLHSSQEIAELDGALKSCQVNLCPDRNFIDELWSDRPAPPQGKVAIHPIEFAGEPSGDKRARLGATLVQEGARAAVITLPDSLSWLLNIRGTDIARNPVVQALGILHADGTMSLFIDAAKLTPAVRDHLGKDVQILPPEAFLAELRSLTGPVRVDRATAPFQIASELAAAGVDSVSGQDPCILPKALKNPTEISGMHAAHLRDGAAMVEFLCWLDEKAPKGGLTEIEVVTALEGFRRATNALQDLSFETICGSGPNGAIIHYRVSKGTDRELRMDEIVVIDSGGQYLDGTTDITRTIAVGSPDDEARLAFTRVLQGMIGISRLRWPKGVAGQHLDAIARYQLWLAGQDYDHGTGHGVGAYLSVHEGPAGLSRRSDVALAAGMVLSNEPGYYRDGAFGIRLENLIVVKEAEPLEGGDGHRQMLDFDTLTFVPIDRRLIATHLLTRAEVDWLDAYHGVVLEKIGPRVSAAALIWLRAACAAL